MEILRRLVFGLLGSVLLLHGLANTVFPLRGVDAGGVGDWLEPVTLMWVAAVIGFVSAGLAMLGVRPLRRSIVPGVLVGGLASLTALAWQPDAGLWPGVLLSAVLPVVTILAVTHVGTGESPVPSFHPRWRMAGDAIGMGLFAWIAVSAVLWPWHREWGTVASEWEMALPGDHAPRTPDLEIMHAVTIDAPPDKVWPWLVQIGQDRGGFYSYTSLERAFGAHVTNADVVHAEWQSLQAGDRVHAVQENYLGGVFSTRPGWTVDRVDRHAALVLRNWGAFVLSPTASGKTRFLIRSTISNPHIPAWLAGFNFAAFELPHFIMQRRMMLGIKERAEREIHN